LGGHTRWAVAVVTGLSLNSTDGEHEALALFHQLAPKAKVLAISKAVMILPLAARF
jgi:hypothetical protein